ncbi:hypothetical protein DPEC_G00229880 [Dallia pectoralis]|uniref:Uncharacterized protein n=1 Tax=Dallia pectoralis TaxID=75939 RepID=A0ACC2G1S7_DALPE|nr:hypothetical protein DPEC_G00229880 [Dallia pectoralis]
MLAYRSSNIQYRQSIACALIDRNIETMLHEQGEKEGKKKIDGTGTDREREEAGRGEKDERTSPVRGAVERETSNGDMCLRHNEQLRMFCDRDKERICVTCWELEHHDHMIKTLSHADKELKREVTAAMGLLQRAIGEVEELRKKQETITSSNRLRNLLVKSHITSQFKEIREQLSVLEERAVRQTEELNENDDRRLAEFEEVLQGSRKKEAQLKAGVEMDDFGGFLRWWTETGQAETMAANSSLSDHLICAICTEIYNDPVTLSCQHTFCMKCLQKCLQAGHQDCSVCRVPVGQQNFQINRLVRNLANQLRMEEQASCLEHKQTLTHFCETDEKLVCAVCMSEKCLQGHTFKSLKEAQVDLKIKLTSVVGRLNKEISQIEEIQKAQGDNVSKNLQEEQRTKISSQFAEVYKQLKRIEERAMAELETTTSLAALDQVLSEGRGTKAELQTGLNMDDPRGFLHWWTESGQTASSNWENRQFKCPKDSSLGLTEKTSCQKQADSFLQFVDLRGIKQYLSKIIGAPNTFSSPSECDKGLLNDKFTDLSSTRQVVRTHSWKNWKWNNLSVSIVHSTVTAVWAIASAAHSPVMLEDMYSATSPLAYLLVCFSTGYFIHDAADIVFSGNSRTSWEFLLHHVLVLFFFLRSIVTRLYVAGVVVALFVEVNSIFLHARRMLLLARIDTCSYHYSLARHINLFTFIFFRLGAQYLITRFIILNYTWLDHAPYLLAAIGAMNIMMLVYLCRLVRADFMTRRDNGRSRTHDKGNSLLKED